MKTSGLKKMAVVALLLVCVPLGWGQSWPNRSGAGYYAQGHIMVPKEADSIELRAARLLADFLEGFVVVPEPEQSDSLYSVANPQYGHMPPAVFVGHTRWAERMLQRKEEVLDDGFRLLSDGRVAAIYGQKGKSVLYGAARLLELKGFRMTHHQIPDVAPTILPGLPVVDEVNNPSFAYREMWYYTPHHSPTYADWHGLHRRIRVGPDGQYIDDKQSAGPLRWADGMYVHTFQKLIPPAIYFDRHPEWFSQIGGQRVRDGQLCLSNPQVLDTLCANLATMMQQQPEAQVWSVSNNDNYNVCQCPHCRHADSLYGGPSGTLIHFVNQVARRFPDKTISTLGYQFTRRAPQPVGGHIEKPDSNVSIMFCSIECGRQEPIATAAAEASFRKDMEDWAALCRIENEELRIEKEELRVENEQLGIENEELGIEKEELRVENGLSRSDDSQISIHQSRLYVWDYVVQFRNMWDPFPNLHVLQPNLKYFHDHGVRWMFEQGTGANNVTSWMELREYLLAKLMWNVEADADSLMHDFCRHYYGWAAQPVEELYREMVRSLVASGKRLDIYGYPIDAAEGYLAPAQMAKYQALIRAAYDSLGRYDSEGRAYYADYGLFTDQVVRDRIRFLELSIDYAVLELTMAGVLPMDSTFVSRANNFVRDGKRLGINILHEMGYTLDEYRSDIESYVSKCYKANLARNCSVTLKAQPKEQYFCGGGAGLTDGQCGTLDYRHAWLGFYGDTLDAVVDLGRRQRVNEVRLDFFFYPLSWIFLPQRVEFYLSNNGCDWQLADTRWLANPEVLAVPQIKTCATRGLKRRARYVRVVAVPLETIPTWHRATGNAPWVFTDEIIVR